MAAETTGLWVGEAVLDHVNEVVVSFDSQNRRVATPPQTETPTSDKSSVRVIFHVDDSGNVRLLKGVAIISEQSAGSPPNTVLLTDPQRFSDYPVPARRIASVAFEFGDESADSAITEVARTIADHVAETVNSAIASDGEAPSGLAFELGIDAASSAGDDAVAGLRSGARFIERTVEAALQLAVTSKATLPPAATPTEIADEIRSPVRQAVFIGLGRLTLLSQGALLAEAISAEVTEVASNNDIPPLQFDTTVSEVIASLSSEVGALTSALDDDAFTVYDFASALDAAPPAAARAAMEAATLESTAFGADADSIRDAARSAVLAAPTIRSARRFAQRATLPDLPVSGELVAGGKVQADIYLGPNHPVNPFRHRRHPDHTEGIELRRHITLEIASSTSGSSSDPAGYGTQSLTGTYSEEFFGIHKALGSNKDIGLRTKGTFTLFRIDQTGSLNP